MPARSREWRYLAVLAPKAKSAGWTGVRRPHTKLRDVVYVPRQTWHLASFGGEEGQRSCRLAMNGFPYQTHMFEPD